MNMKLLITSGGTSEAIDQVRAITNHASGNLGKIIAEQALKRGHEVTLVTTRQAVKPDSQKNLTIIEITNVDSLKETLEPLVKSHQALIHSMAVSDYTPVYMAGLDELRATEDISSLLKKQNTESKISSKDDYQVLFLKKTPKVISYVKKWNPAITLFGFKLLVDVSKEELLSVARESLVQNKADYILANDLVQIGPNQHRAYLVSTDDAVSANTKEEIAELLLKTVQKEGK
ncbi:phosphopantothenate--cysteine ligase [Streptococcus suis]|nr:phosphopantothenate--cysteine ligase [Streptococcus suis]HEM3165776.1 phosphopantothenate--cysteine ligase [Streptococcus suis 92-1191]HEM5140424.1 phosphopantothenate--cysteine ligase [Streptococcus suis]HEM5264293.1 phosphopantothenate--cysteine ligase [Streptococcus suis]HEM6181019.1 phosphopantothenate--cysteine ligase [Streptococcus suis]